MNGTLEAYGRSLNIRPAGDDGTVECVHQYPPPCEGSHPSWCKAYGCDRRGGKLPEMTESENALWRAELCVRIAIHVARAAA